MQRRTATRPGARRATTLKRTPAKPRVKIFNVTSPAKKKKVVKKTPGRRKGQRPRFIQCHICGREFGTHSMKFHTVKCVKKWEQREALKPAKERRPVPKAPVAAALIAKASSPHEIDALNAKMREAHEQNMAQCPHCKRTFNEDRLVKHSKSCTASRPGKSVKDVVGEHKRAKVLPKDLPVCHDCKTRQPLKYRKCAHCGAKRKRTKLVVVKREMKKPAKVAKWRQESQGLQQAIRVGRKLKRMQDQGYSVAEIVAVLPTPVAEVHPDFVPCPHCKRTFNEGAAERHIPKCKNLRNRPAPAPTYNRYASPSQNRTPLRKRKKKKKLSSTMKPGWQSHDRKSNSLSQTSPFREMSSSSGGGGGFQPGNHTSMDNPLHSSWGLGHN